MMGIQLRVSLALLCGALLLMGCVQDRPIVSMPGGRNSMTLEEQREWVAEHLDAAVTASNISSGWTWKGGAVEPLWTGAIDEDRSMILESLFPNNCGDNAGRLDMSLKNTDAEDPLAATARVREFWESEGHAVRDLYATHNDIEPYFIVDFEDGGSFSMQAGATGMTMSVHTACAAGAMVRPRGSSGDDPANPFAEELERRGEGTASVD
ncbi:hypothetical protein [Leucobacter tenebrionis]|uniref:hypothetical protein n=1 Tax=Leucobacter tenebrionis TaxID=2873270 RepID=UPI001CA73918|nr:hypothetical protein [Leucobacter tenebrionis]QZY52992.1 hypothetical protein KVY00_06045 [Leucobacter tenebrionis]